MYKYFLLFFGVFLLAPIGIRGQIIYENAPPNMRWHELNTPNFKVIYPENFEQNAQRVANKLEHIYVPVTETMDAKPRKIPIILQNRSVISNGFVSMIPRRSELFTMPPQDYNFLGTNNWLDLIAVHEYRHVVQFEQSLTGINKVLHTLFGQFAQAGLAQIAVPRWFWEGDATLIETLYTQSGRGRIPDFNRIYRTNLLEGKKFNYSKQHLGSFKDFVPNHYVLGYNYVTHIRRRTGDPDIWEKITDDSFAKSILPYTFSNAIKKHTGMGVRKNYQVMQDSLKEFWTNQLEELDPELYKPLVDSKKVFTNYFYPRKLDLNRLVVMKDGLGDVRQLVVLDSLGNEVDKYITGIFNDAGMLSASNGKVVWNEIYPDVRWARESASVIKLHDFYEGSTKVLSRNSRYAGADLSPRGDKVVTSLTTEKQEHFLVTINAYNGAEIEKYATPSNDFLSMARFSSDGEKIVSLTISDRGKGVIAFDVETGEIDYLVPEGTENIGHPVLHENFLFFNSPYNGIDNIHALDLNSGQRYQITNSRYGAYNPEVDEKEGVIFFNNHERLGMNISSIPNDTSFWMPYYKAPVSDEQYFDPLLQQESMLFMEELDSVKYPSSRFRSVKHLFNPHSWGPVATTDLNNVQLAIYSEDILRTTGLTAGYEYNINDRSGVWFGDLTYQGFFPIFDLRFEYGDRRVDDSFAGQEFSRTWQETTTQAGVRLPLNLTRSKFFSQMEFGYNIGIRNISNYDNGLIDEATNPLITDRIYPAGTFIINEDTVDLAFFDQNEIENGTLAFDRINFSYYLLQKQSLRDLNPRWGFLLNAELFNTRDFFNNDFDGRLTAIRSTIFLPSLPYLINDSWFKHHSLFVRAHWQNRQSEFSPNLYYFRNRIFKPRGYAYPSFEEFTTISANYIFPLFYPDWTLGPVLFIKRVKLNLFYDWGRGTGFNYFVLNEPNYDRLYFSRLDRTYQSVGAELTFDLNVFRFPADIDLGVRYTHTLDPQDNQFEFLLLNINI